MSIFSTIFPSWATSSNTENMLFSQGWWIISETWKVYCLTASPNLCNMYLCKRIALVKLRISLVHTLVFSSQKVTILLDLEEPWQQHVWWVAALIYGIDLPKVLFGSWWRHANYKKLPKISVAILLLTSCKYCSAVCVCLCSSTCWFLSDARHLWYTWEVRINDLLLWAFSGCFCQVPSSLFPNLSYFTSKDENSNRFSTGEKTI